MIRIAVIAAVALLLGGCSTMSEEDCATADWTALGERDGLYGESQKKYEERRAQCSKYGYETATDDYARGRDRGLRTYCTPQAGFDAGRNGRPYNNVCPPELESAFLSEYQIGRRLYDLTERVKRARAKAMRRNDGHRVNARLNA
ncbi:MAG: DUF2799 domain-containing protein, partial [Parvularculaceae bacterium]|nr:DUF2799 domain-containing protein [Parvularculaceae bacterium]